MTYHPKSHFIATMMERGFLANCTDDQGLDDALSAGIVPGHIDLVVYRVLYFLDQRIILTARGSGCAAKAFQFEC